MLAELSRETSAEHGNELLEQNFFAFFNRAGAAGDLASQGGFTMGPVMSSSRGGLVQWRVSWGSATHTTSSLVSSETAPMEFRPENIMLVNHNAPVDRFQYPYSRISAFSIVVEILRDSFSIAQILRLLC
jgi:hypothetical protein